VARPREVIEIVSILICVFILGFLIGVCAGAVLRGREISRIKRELSKIERRLEELRERE